MEHASTALPYAMYALEPHIPYETFEYQCGRQHLAHIINLNKLIADTDYERLSLESIIKIAPAGDIYNAAAQVWNNTFFWHCMKQKGGGTPSGALAEAINQRWGNFDEFRQDFQSSAAGNSNAGWTWLVRKSDGSVDNVKIGSAGTPLNTSYKALMCIDVWEPNHFVSYRNMRPKFVEAFLNNLVNWDFAAKNFDQEHHYG